MKVNEILVEAERVDDTDCVRGIVMDTFNERYTELDAVFSLDLEDIKHSIESKNNESLAQAASIVSNLISLQASDDLYIHGDEQLLANLDALERGMDNNTPESIASLVDFLSSYVVTFNKWSETQEGQEAIAAAMEQCEDQANPHAARGVSPSDFN